MKNGITLNNCTSLTLDEHDRHYSNGRIVVTDNEWLMRNRTVLSLDAAEVLGEAQKALEYLVEHSKITI